MTAGREIPINEIKEMLRLFIKNNFYELNISSLKDSDILLDSGIDSSGLLMIIEYIEDAFDTRILNDDVTEENFSTLEMIASYIFRKIKKR